MISNNLVNSHSCTMPRFDTHHLEEYAQTSAALEKATSALAQLEGELSRRSETASAHLVNNSEKAAFKSNNKAI
ncbi:hypothetical protein L2E82_39293 [Cichorium intybus]|uniref:Uncharacterized protein n=1 Tax=Cichorium intybus TaxID=13427 RepID=A0ACB9AIG1_CICIN|nr:hypothetical protein L2E82_39293 [Cichorium intybus]